MNNRIKLYNFIMGKEIDRYKRYFKKMSLFNKFNERLIEKEKTDVKKNLFIFEELLKFAIKIRRFSQNDWKDEIKNDIRYARIINGIRKAS